MFNVCLAPKYMFDGHDHSGWAMHDEVVNMLIRGYDESVFVEL